RVTVGGRDTREHRPRDLADVVGIVGQDPMAGFVTDTVEDELAYGMESLGVPPDVMRRRVEETLDLLGLADVRDRPLTSLSGGQRQRTAIGAALTPHSAVLVLVEPTSARDAPASAEGRGGRGGGEGRRPPTAGEERQGPPPPHRRPARGGRRGGAPRRPRPATPAA